MATGRRLLGADFDHENTDNTETPGTTETPEATETKKREKGIYRVRGFAASMLTCQICGRKILAFEVKYRVTQEGVSKLICPDDAKKLGI